MNKPPFLAIIAGRNGYSVKPNGWGGYHLLKAGERFPLAGGSMAQLLRVYQGL